MPAATTTHHPSARGVRGPFKSRVELERHALHATKGHLSRQTVTMFVDQVWPACEENYPSAETIDMQCKWAEKLAWDRTAHMTDEELLVWLEDTQSRGVESSEDFNITQAGNMNEVQAARERNHMLPVMIASLDHPETILCPERYGKWVLPNGKEVVSPVAGAYNEVIARRQTAAIEARERRAKLPTGTDAVAASIKHSALADGTKLKMRSEQHQQEDEAKETWAERERRQAKEGIKYPTAADIWSATQKMHHVKLAQLEQEYEDARKASDAADAAAYKERQRRQARRQAQAAAELASATKAETAAAAARVEEERLAREAVEAPERKAALEERKAQEKAVEDAKQVVLDQRAKDAAAKEAARLAAASEAKKRKKAEKKARRKAPLEILVQEKQREEQREEDAKAEAARVKKVARDLLRHHG